MEKYRWKIDITLSCGKEITGIYNGEENTSMDVGKFLLQGKSDDIFTLGNEKQTAQYFIKRSEVAYMAISLE